LRKKGNGTDAIGFIDRQMVKLMENNLSYRTAVELLLRKIAILKEVIREGGQ